MAGKPSLGFATRTEAVLALRASGHSTRAIADYLGIETKTVAALEVSALRSITRRSKPPAEQGRAMLVPQDIMSRLRRPAERRGILPNELAARIVETVVDAELIDAVLDDQVSSAEW